MESAVSYFHQESERLIYRKLTQEDCKSWEVFFDGNERLHFLGLDVSKSREILAKEWIDRQMERYENEGTGLLAVIEKSTGDLIGMCGIIQRTLFEKTEFEIGYSFMQNQWKKGFATEAAIQMRKFGINNKLSNRLISIIHKENTDSMSVARRNEMQPLRDTVFMGMDVVIFGTEMAGKE